MRAWRGIYPHDILEWRLSKDSAFWLKTAISSPRFVDRPLVLSSLRGLKNAVFSSKILESHSSSEAQITKKRPNPESTFDNTARKSKKVDSRICDEKSLLCKRVQGRILGVCNCSTREAIKDLSRKAESTKR